ncbi:MAG TPA: transposase [Pyrinomonadaceae bacterium]|nr:transposase [Pyrinomonadaceae bacterium]
MTNFDWDDNEWPLAFLITIRTFGTWLHGDDRYSMDRHGQNVYGTPKIQPNSNLVRTMADNRSAEPFLLNGKQRSVVENSIREVCKHRGYGLLAINFRTNHGHSVVAAENRPEQIMTAFKANATRSLKAAGLISDGQKVWSRGGSRRYLWKPNHVEGAMDYVLYGQGDDLPNF